MAENEILGLKKKIASLERKIAGLEEEREHLGEERESLEAVIQANLALNCAFPLKDLLTFILTSARSVMRCETASILLLNEKVNRLEFAISLDEAGQKLLNMPLEKLEGIAGKVAESCKPHISGDVRKDPYFAPRFDRISGFETHSILAIPLLVREKLIGVMELINKGEGAFTPLDLRRSTALASLAAVAIENARLYKKAEEMGNRRETSRLTTELMALVAHELKTPVVLIKMFSDLVREQKDLERGKLEEYFENISDELSRLDRLIDDFFTISLLESGKIPLNLENLSLSELLLQRLQFFAQTPSCHRLKSHFPSKDIRVRADRDRTIQIFDNLLGNALKFSPLGGTVEVSLKEEPDRVRVSVQDEGIGIRPEDQPQIFQFFSRGSSPEALSIKGAGLGLALAKLLVERLGGSIWFTSEPGRGTTFFFTLPKISESSFMPPSAAPLEGQ